MPGTARRSRLYRMIGTRVAITLELEVAGDTLAGRATGQNGESVDFAGWLGLVSAIDALLPGADAEGSNARSAASRTAGNGVAHFSAAPRRVTVSATQQEEETP